MKKMSLFLIYFIILVALPAHAQEIWTDMSTPKTNWLFDVWGAASDNLYVVGTQGRIFHYNGSGWTLQDSGVSDHLYDVWGRSDVDIAAVGQNGTILRSDGSSWDEVLHGLTNADLHAVWGPEGSSELFIAGDAGTILYFNGSAWSAMSSGTTADLRGIWGSSANDVYAVGESGTILHYDGSSWSAMASGSTRRLNRVWGSSSDNVYAVGDQATILRYDGDGNNDGTPDGMWESVLSYASPNGVWLYDVWGTESGDHIYAAGTHGAVLHSADNGTTWSDNEPGIGTPYPTKYNLYGIWGFPTGSQIFAVGLDGTIKIYAAGNWTETKLDDATVMWLYDVWGSSPDSAYAVGESGTIVSYDGLNWTSMSSGTTSALYGVWGTSDSDVFAVGKGGRIRHYDGNPAGAWYGMTSNTTNNLNAVWGSSSTDVYAAGNSGTIVRYDGSQWVKINHGLTTVALNGVWGSSESDVYAVGNSGAILHYNGTQWENVPHGLTTVNLNSIWGSSAGDVYAVGNCSSSGACRILHYNGTGWSLVEDCGSEANLKDIWGSAANDIFVVESTKSGVLHYDGIAWQRIVLDPLPDGTDHWFEAVWGTSWDNLIAVGVHHLGMVSTIMHHTVRCQSDDDCSDGIFCNGSEACNLDNGTCQPGPDPCPGRLCDEGSDVCVDCLSAGDCSDGNPCTDDTCDAGICSHDNNTEACDDGSFCTENDLCSGGSCAGTPIVCNDDNVCTQDTCIPESGCQYDPADNGTSCADDDVCNGAETCQSGTCTAGTALDCNDGNPCTDDACDATAGCQYDNNTSSCDDGNACTSGDACANGTCQGALITCNDDNVCTQDTCDPLSGCQFAAVADGTACLDNDVCNGAETCQSGTCTAGTALDCNDGNPCTDDACDAIAGCQYDNNTSSCDDGNACTSDDACANGTCQGALITCNDDDGCTLDTCDPSSGCLYTPVPGCQCDSDIDCNDNNTCTGTESCVNGTCVAGTPLDCNDGNPCTDDACDAVAGCKYTNNEAPCSDGLYCTSNDVCSNGLCIGSGSPCGPSQSCIESTDTCVTPGGGSTGGSSGGGGGTTPPAKECTSNADCPAAKPYCASDTGTCVLCLNDTNCTDSLYCTGEEICFNNECFSGALPCAENEICDEQADVCTIPAPPECEADADCDDGVFCNGEEQCAEGTCTRGEAPCGPDQLCRDAIEQCWDLLTISSTTTFNPEIAERSVFRPLLLEQRCIWLRVMAESAHHFAVGKSTITLQRANEGAVGVTIDQTRTPMRGLLFENAVWVPICIAKDATIGRWEIKIETEVSDAETPFLETIQGHFIIQ